MLFANAVLVSFAVASRTRADTSLKTPSTQNLTTGETNEEINACYYISFPTNKGYFIQYNSVCFKIALLSGFQSDDDKNRPSVHSANTAGVTHEIV